jgi:RNA polymerase sigma-70 factor (ECF subfamily)
LGERDVPPENASADEHAVVRRVVAGETDLYRVLVERYQRRIFYLGRKFFSSPEDVEDYVQEVFLRAYKKLGSFSGAGPPGTGGPDSGTAETGSGAAASFGGWLYSLAFRHALNTRRSRKKLREDFFAEIDAREEELPEDRVMREETVSNVRTALEDLPGLYAFILRLKYFEGLTFKEIAGITGIAEGTLKSHVHRCKKILRTRMKGLQGGHA